MEENERLQKEKEEKERKEAEEANQKEQKAAEESEISEGEPENNNVQDRIDSPDDSPSAQVMIHVFLKSFIIRKTKDIGQLDMVTVFMSNLYWFFPFKTYFFG